MKLIGSTDGFFPDMGHHQAKEMNGMWLHPIKLLDGFWLRLEDHSTNGQVNTWIRADGFINHPYGNTFLYGQGLSHTSISVERFQFSPDSIGGCVVSYTFTHHGNTPIDVTCDLLARTDLHPVWHSEDIGLYDGETDEVVYLDTENLFLAKDNAHEWYAAIGSNTKPVSVRTGSFFAAEITAGNGVSVSMTFDFHFAPGETKELVFYFAGSDQSREDCLNQYAALHPHPTLLEEKKQRYDTLRAASELTTTDSAFDEVYEWIKANTDWMVLQVPAIGRGLTAGLPEYPFWFGCDGCYAIMGLIATGRFTLAKQTLRILREASERHNGNGRIVHEVTAAGVVCNPGNTQETAQFINTLWEYYQWTGDLAFIRECFPYVQKSIQWLQEMDEDGDFFPSGYGIIEIAGMNMELIDTAVYTCTAFDACGKIYTLMGDPELSRQMHALSDKTREAIMRVFWLPERGLFADTVTTTDTVKKKLTMLTKWDIKSEHVRAYLKKEIDAKEMDEHESGWLLNESWVIATPMEAGIAPAEYADIALANLHTDRFIGPYGAYLSGVYHSSTMTISSGVYAVAQARYGYADRALELLRRMFSTFSLATPGSISEMSPDYGCFVQAWTLYGPGVTVVKYFFGIQPDAFNGYIVFSPSMPVAFERAELKNVAVLDGSVSVTFQRTRNKSVYTVCNQTGFPIKVENILPDTEITVNGEKLW